MVIAIHDILGRNVANLSDGLKEPGENTLTWDAVKMPSGVYFAIMNAGGYIKTGRMVLLK